MEVERLRRVLADLSDTLVALQRQIEQANQLIATVSLPPSVPTTSPTSHSVHGSQRHSPSGSARVLHLEQRIGELETNKRELADNLRKVLDRHETCQHEIHNAVRAREGIMKRYRLLVRVASDLLQRVMEEFPSSEEYDDETRSAVEEDLRRSLRSPSTSASSSSGTARPRAGGINRSSNIPVRSPDIVESQAGPGGSTLRTNSPSTVSHRSALAQTPAFGQDGNLLTWQIHTGSKIPASVKNIAGPFAEQDFARLGIEKAELDDLFQGLIHPNDASIRLGIAPSSRGLEHVKFVFLYDPFYLESGTKTYILDWVTPRASNDIVNWLKNSARGDESPVFHTFTFSKNKNRWYYFGGMRWGSVRLDIWPTLGDESRNSILKHLSNRSHGTAAPEEIKQQMMSGWLQEVCIEIASACDMDIMQEVAMRLGQSPRQVKTRRPVAIRGEE